MFYDVIKLKITCTIIMYKDEVTYLNKIKFGINGVWLGRFRIDINPT